MLMDFFHYDFLRNALAAGLLASILCGVVGTFVVVKRLVFISGGISHAAFGGLGICYFLGFAPVFGALAVAVITALALGLGGESRLRKQDALTGVLWALGMALGLVFIHMTPGFAPNLMSFLFGDILTVTQADVQRMAIIAAATILIVVVGFKPFVAVAFDEVFAHVQGIPVRLVMSLLLVLTALTIVVMIQVVGVTLVIALLTLPTMMGLVLSRSFLPVMCWSVGLGMAMTLIGLAVSYLYDMPSGPTIVLSGVLMWLLVIGGNRLLSRRREAVVAEIVETGV